MRLSVLDQSPVLAGASAAEALAATLDLAQAADRLGYHRYWVAEHHAMAAVADPCPEILVGRIASLTQRIRVGTGGILLPYYSPLKVAESFRMLEALFPGRIDLGVGRAPGGDMRTAQALLRGGARFDPGAFPGQIEALRDYLAGGETDGVYATPSADTAPELSWSEAEQASPQEAAVHITGPAGSVFFFDCRTFHSAAPNFTNSPRIAMTVRYSPSWLATEAGAGRTSGQPGPWEPLPEDFFAGLSPEAQKRFVHAHRWDINDHLPLAPFPFGNRDNEQLLVRQRG